ncbi:unnamed protein product, partial [Arabidopsis halleri]
MNHRFISHHHRYMCRSCRRLNLDLTTFLVVTDLYSTDLLLHFD